MCDRLGICIYRWVALVIITVYNHPFARQSYEDEASTLAYTCIDQTSNLGRYLQCFSFVELMVQTNLSTWPQGSRLVLGCFRIQLNLSSRATYSTV